MNTDFAVRAKIFEGPLALLLELIEKRKLHINEISLSQVTNDFLEHVGQLEKRDLDKLTEFISVASTLILIKSKSLLPQLDLSNEEENEVEDLELRLKLLQIFQNASKDIKTIFGTNISHTRRHPKNIQIEFTPTPEITADKMKWYADQLLQNLPKKEKLKEKRVSKTISLEEMMNKVINRVRQNMTISFRSISGEHTEKRNVIIGFLAILELVKLGTVDTTQDGKFADIMIESKNPHVPSYGA